MTNTATKERDEFEHAKGNAKRWLASIAEMLHELEIAPYGANNTQFENAERAIRESVLSVLVRDGWHEVGKIDEDGPCEYEILLSTGGPALRIVGSLGRYNEPETATLEIQDWYVPWTAYDQKFGLTEIQAGQLIQFARQFYFGE